VEGRAILYADKVTDSMRRAIDETDRRRAIQRAFNEENGITPRSIISQVEMGLAHILKAEYGEVAEEEAEGIPEFASRAELDAYIAKLETEMREAARKFEFEKAARLRDSIKELRGKELMFG
jgi:excinuclease ABC subunit B